MIESWEAFQQRQNAERAVYIAAAVIEKGSFARARHDMGISMNSVYRYLEQGGLKSRDISRAAKVKWRADKEDPNLVAVRKRIDRVLDKSHPDYLRKVAATLGVAWPESPDAGRPWRAGE